MKQKLLILLIYILVVGIFFRVYNLNNTFPFSGEFGDNLLDVKYAVLHKQIPLLGPPTSHPWLNFGPLYIWVMIPFMKLFNFDPLVGAWIGCFIAVITIIENYLIVKNIINNKVALLSSLLIAVSPLWISFSKDARFYFIVTLLFYPFIYLLKNVYEKNNGYFKLGFVYSLFFHFHYSPILLFPVMIYFILFKRKNLKIVSCLYFLVGLIIPQIPIIIYDAKNNFSMFAKLFLWIPYRIAGFFGIYPKNNLSVETFKQSINSTTEYIGKTFFYESKYWIVVSVIVLAMLLSAAIKYLLNKKYNFLYSFCYLSIAISLLGIIIHGDVPVHYFLPVFPVLLIIISGLLISFFEKQPNFVKGLIVGTFVLTFFINTKYFINYYSKFNKNTFIKKPNFVSLDLQKRIAQGIVNDSKNQKYSLVRVGPGDNFEDYYSQNYKYLLWVYGNEPVEKSDIIYTIYEESDNNISKITKTMSFGEIKVTKYEKK